MTQENKIPRKLPEAYLDVETVLFLMRKNHIDLKELAKRVGVMPATVKRWLDGADQKYINADFIVKVAHALDTTISTVLTWECKKPVEK